MNMKIKPSFGHALFQRLKTASAETNFFDFSVELGMAHLTLEPNANVYYVIQGSTQLPQFTPWDITLGDEGAAYHVPATNAQMFFQPLSISIYSPRFTLGDGIDDLFKLRRGLDPLDAALAGQNSGFMDANGQPLTWLQFYLQQFARNIPNGENFSREVSVFNFGQPAAPVEAVSREVSIYNGESPTLSDLQEVYSRDGSVFTIAPPTAAYEAISREVSLFNNIEGATN